MGEYAKGKHPNSLANLRRPWVQGESGNAKGERGPIITPHLERFTEMTMAQLLALDETKLRVGEALARARILAALDLANGARDRSALEDRLDGKVTEKQEISGAGGGPINIVRESRADLNI